MSVVSLLFCFCIFVVVVAVVVVLGAISRRTD